MRITFALLLLLAGLVVSARCGRDLLPFWYPVAVLAAVALRGVPSLSSEITFSPRGLAIAGASWPGLALLAITASIALVRGRSPVRVAVGQLALPVACALGALVLAGAAATLAGGPPPLVPYASPAASFALAITAAGAEALALPLLARAVLPGIGRSRSDAPPR